MSRKIYMTKDTNDSMALYEAAGRKWKLVREEPQGFRVKIREALEVLGAREIGKEYTDLAAYHFYVVLDIPEVKE